jgi:hypothetical protein
MYRILTMMALLVGLSGCFAGFGFGDNGQHPTSVAVAAQASTHD